jgi:hypothetical protein
VLHPPEPRTYADKEPARTPPAAPERDKHPRFPGAIIRPGSWLDSRCPWSERAVPELVGERGRAGTPAASRQGGLPCGPDTAPQRKRRCAEPGAEAVQHTGGAAGLAQRLKGVQDVPRVRRTDQLTSAGPAWHPVRGVSSIPAVRTRRGPHARASLVGKDAKPPGRRSVF